MDESETALVATSHVAGAMNYRSTTQALFALIVMIIVLVFILVYCCWGTFSCARQDDASTPAPEDTAVPNSQPGVRHILHGPHTVIVPINNMIYVGDPETHQIYQIPLNRDKPPAYTEVFRAGPPPPYRLDIAASDSEVNGNTTTTLRGSQNNRTALPESPPAYDDCLSAAPEDRGEEQGSTHAISYPLQHQQEAAAATSHISLTIPASAVTVFPRLPTQEPNQEAQDLPPPRRDVVLTISSLPEAQQASRQQAAEEGPSNPSLSANHI